MSIPLDQYMREQRTVAAENTEAEAQERERAELAEAAERYAKLDELCKNPVFQWFLSDMVKPMVDDKLKDAMDVKKSPADRNDHCQQHDAAKTILDMAEVHRTFYKQKGGYVM